MKDEHDIEARRHAHHAHYRKQDQRIKLAVVFVFDLKVTNRHQDGQPGSGKKQVVEVNGEVVEHHGVHESKFEPVPDLCRFELGILDLQHSSRGKKHTHKCGHGIRPLPLRRNHQVDQQDAQREHGEHDDRKGQQIVRAGEVLWRPGTYLRPLRNVGSKWKRQGRGVRRGRLSGRADAFTAPLIPG